MDRDTLNTAISDGTIRITMNDGSTYEIQDQKSMLVDATTAYVLQRATDGRLRACQCRNHYRCHVIGKYILTSDLNYARTRCVSQSKHRPKVQVVCKHNQAI